MQIADSQKKAVKVKDFYRSVTGRAGRTSGSMCALCFSTKYVSSSCVKNLFGFHTLNEPSENGLTFHPVELKCGFSRVNTL